MVLLHGLELKVLLSGLVLGSLLSLHLGFPPFLYHSFKIVIKILYFKKKIQIEKIWNNLGRPGLLLSDPNQKIWSFGDPQYLLSLYISWSIKVSTVTSWKMFRIMKFSIGFKFIFTTE